MGEYFEGNAGVLEVKFEDMFLQLPINDIIPVFQNYLLDKIVETSKNQVEATNVSDKTMVKYLRRLLFMQMWSEFEATDDLTLSAGNAQSKKFRKDFIGHAKC